MNGGYSAEDILGEHPGPNDFEDEMKFHQEQYEKDEESMVQHYVEEFQAHNDEGQDMTFGCEVRYWATMTAQDEQGQWYTHTEDC